MMLAARARAQGISRPLRAPSLLTLLLSAPVLLPLLYLVLLAAQASPGALWEALVRANAGWLLVRMCLMATGATLWALLLGAPWAWLVARTDVPGRRFFQWVGPLPLAIPPYVGALVYVMLLARGGMLHDLIAAVLGRPAFEVPFPGWIYGPAGAAFVLGIFTSPYVFLNVYGALQRVDPAVEDAARGLGYTPREVLWRMLLPLLRPALLAGALLVFVYSWVDFGVVSLLRARTFTTVIYTYLLAGFSLPSAAGLSLLLVGVVGLVLLLQHRALGQARYSQADRRSVTPRLAPLGAWRWAGAVYLAVVATLTLFLPLGVLVFQALKLPAGELVSLLLEQLPYVWNSLQVALTGSLLVLLLASVIGWRIWRGQSGRLAGGVLQAGYAIPGTVLGLSLVGLSLAAFPALYGHPAMLVFAYVVLFAAPTLQGVRAALAQVPTGMEEAVRALGQGPVTAAVRVVGPLAWSGLAATWLLTFVLTLRELAATLVLRPAGFDTLPVRIWVQMDTVGPDPRAAATALLLVVLVGLPWLVILLARRPFERANPLG